MSPLCRQLAEVVQERYLSGPERAKRHGVLADFFSGAWSQGTKKLITLPLVGKPLNLDRKVNCLSGTPAHYLHVPPCCAGKAKPPWPGPPCSFFSIQNALLTFFPSLPTESRMSPQPLSIMGGSGAADEEYALHPQHSGVGGRRVTTFRRIQNRPKLLASPTPGPLHMPFPCPGIPLFSDRVPQTDSYLNSETQLRCPLVSLSPKFLPLPRPCLGWAWGTSVWNCVPVPSSVTHAWRLGPCVWSE